MFFLSLCETKAARSNLERYCKTQIQLREKNVAEAFQLKLCTYIYINIHNEAFSRAQRVEKERLYYLSCILSQIHYKRNKNAVAIWIKILLVCACCWKCISRSPTRKKWKSSSSASKNLLKLIRMCCFSPRKFCFIITNDLLKKCVTR